MTEDNWREIYARKGFVKTWQDAIEANGVGVFMGTLVIINPKYAPGYKRTLTVTKTR